MTAKREYRSIGASLRAAPSDKFVLTGTAASYGVLSKPIPGGRSGEFRERIAPGCFKRSLQGGDGDVLCLVNHGVKNDTVLGRTGNGTLVLDDDEEGLDYRCQLDPNQQSHRDLYYSVKRGDLSECSFAFSPDADGEDWDEAEDEEERGHRTRFTRRTLRSAKLYDVSIVNRPAYDGATSVSARSFDYVIGRNAPRVATRVLSLEDRYLQIHGKEFDRLGFMRSLRSQDIHEVARRNGMTVDDLLDAQRRNRARALGEEIARQAPALLGLRQRLADEEDAAEYEAFKKRGSGK